MTIFLHDIWPMKDLTDYKVHFARWNGNVQPLEVWARDEQEWQEWQEYRPKRDDFNRRHIFSLIQFYHETDIWLFGGVFRVLARHARSRRLHGLPDGRAELSIPTTPLARSCGTVPLTATGSAPAKWS